MAPRSIKPDEESATAQAPAPAALERGAQVSITATVLRVYGPWVDLSILGEVQHVLRSRLEKELG